VFSKEIPDLLFGIRRCLWRLGRCRRRWSRDRQAGLHAGGARPTEAFAASAGSCASTGTSASGGDPQAKGVVERLQDFAERSFEPGRIYRFDTCDYSLDPALVGRRVEARISDREVLAVALDSGELACRHARSFAKHRTITALEHAARSSSSATSAAASDEAHVEVRSLAAYDALIA
jgi:hypothetical protein